jgi:hypothetical protein
VGDVWVYEYFSHFTEHGGTQIDEDGSKTYTLCNIIKTRDSILYDVELIRDMHSLSWLGNGPEHKYYKDTSTTIITMLKDDSVYYVAPAFRHDEKHIGGPIKFEKVKYNNDTLIRKIIADTSDFRNLIFLESYGVITYKDWIYNFPTDFSEKYTLINFNNIEIYSDSIIVIEQIKIIVEGLFYDNKNEFISLNSIWKQKDLLSCDLYDLHGRCIIPSVSTFDLNKLELSKGFYFLRINLKDRMPYIFKINNFK